ncbi:MAG: hypothetical protein CMB93_05430 [Flammeovirgaceae bacterium]|nr:hypothetical protein [Flammeovirgaceae bacterium]
MRFLVILVLVFTLSCEFEDINKTGQKNAWYFYEVADIGAIEASNSTIPVIAFPSNYYTIGGINNEISIIPISDFYEFIDFSVQDVISLGGKSKFIITAVSNNSIEPVYGLRLISEKSESSVFYHENVESGTFSPIDQQSLYGVLESLPSINDGNEVYLNAQIVYYSLFDDNIDTLSTHRFEIGNIDMSKSMEGFATSGINNLYYAFQDQLFSWNPTTDTLISTPTNTQVKNLLSIDDKIILVGSANELKIYNENLTLDRIIWLSDLIPTAIVKKNTLLKVFTSKKGIHMVLGISKAIEKSDGIFVEQMLTLDLLTLNSEGVLEGSTVILEGNEDQNDDLFWNQFDLVSQNINNNAAYFMFRKQLSDAKYEFLVKKAVIN